jgi:hypothetical protein
MKTLAVLVLCTMAPFAAVAGQAAPAQNPPPQAADQSSSAAVQIDPAKEAAIHKMFEVMDMTKMMQETVAGMSSSIKPVLLSSLAPGEYREKLVDLFFQRFQSKFKAEKLIELAIPVYAKYYTTEEIEGLTAFYKTPLGKKTLSVMPQTVIEMQMAGNKMGEELGRQSMLEVLAEHPDLSKALEDASGGPQN